MSTGSTIIITDDLWPACISTIALLSAQCERGCDCWIISTPVWRQQTFVSLSRVTHQVASMDCPGVSDVPAVGFSHSIGVAAAAMVAGVSVGAITADAVSAIAGPEATGSIAALPDGVIQSVDSSASSIDVSSSCLFIFPDRPAIFESLSIEPMDARSASGYVLPLISMVLRAS